MTTLPERVSPNLTKKQISEATSTEEALQRFLLMQVDLNDNGVYFESDCALCSSTNRNKVEEKWLENRNAKAIRDFLKTDGDPIPLTVIKNHMEFHIDQSYVELRKREYIKRLLTLTKINLDTLGRVELALSSITERIVAVNAAEDPTISTVQLNKIRAESTCRLVSSMTTLLQLRANLLGEMKDQGELLTIRQEDFEAIFNTVLLEHTHPEARNAINDILERFLKASKKQ